MPARRCRARLGVRVRARARARVRVRVRVACETMPRLEKRIGSASSLGQVGRSKQWSSIGRCAASSSAYYGYYAPSLRHAPCREPRRVIWLELPAAVAHHADLWREDVVSKGVDW